jgi:hypothetical protein
VTAGLEVELFRALPVPFSKLLSAMTTGVGAGATTVEFDPVAEGVAEEVIFSWASGMPSSLKST